MNAQREDNEYLATIRQQLEYLPKSVFYAAVEQLDFLKQFGLSKALRNIDYYLSEQIDNKLTEKLTPSHAQTHTDPSLLRMGLDIYFTSKKQKDISVEPCLDPNYRKLMMDQ